MDRMDNFYCLQPESAAAVLNDLYLAKDPQATPSADVQTKNTVLAAATGAAGKVAVIPVSGPLARNTQYSWWGDVAATGYDDIAAAIAMAQDDPAVTAIMLDIDSPGGAVAGVEELARMIAAMRNGQGKPMAAFTNSLMASAAYWVGSATGRVYATPSAEVGSIGVIMALQDLRGAAQKAGVAVNIITAGSMKGAGNPFAELSDDARAHFQSLADGIHAIFKSSVAAAMPVNADMPQEWADGRTFLGADAAGAGLVTRTVSGMAEAIETFLLEVNLMDRQTLEAQAPDLVKALVEEGRAQAMAEAKTMDASTFLACVKPLMGAEQHARAAKFFEACAAAKMNAEQITDMAAVAFAEQPQPEAKAEAAGQDAGQDAANVENRPDARAALLAAIQSVQTGISAMHNIPSQQSARDALINAAAKA